MTNDSVVLSALPTQKSARGQKNFGKVPLSSWSPAGDKPVSLISKISRCYTLGVAMDRLFLEPDPVIEAYKRDIDRSLLRERLKKTPAERVDDLVRLADFAEELRRAGQKARKP